MTSAKPESDDRRLGGNEQEGDEEGVTICRSGGGGRSRLAECTGGRGRVRVGGDGIL